MKTLRAELKKRQEDGELNLIIRFVNGDPLYCIKKLGNSQKSNRLLYCMYRKKTSFVYFKNYNCISYHQNVKGLRAKIHEPGTL